MIGSYENGLHLHDQFRAYIDGKITEFTHNKSSLKDCRIESCSEIGTNRGFCTKHYLTLRRRGYLEANHEKSLELFRELIK
jgi:hypothetical protein